MCYHFDMNAQQAAPTPSRTYSEFVAASYKPFVDQETLPVAPLTVVFGANGAGKSALCRLPVAVAAALRADAKAPAGLPLRVDHLSFGSSFASMRHGDDSPSFTVALRLGDAEASTSLSVTIGPTEGVRASHPRQRIERWLLSPAGDADTLIEWSASAGAYSLNGDVADVRFTGLLPRISDEVLPAARALRDLPPILHFFPSRNGCTREFGEHRVDAALEVGVDGDQTVDVLSTLYAEGARATLSKIDEALRDILGIELRFEELAAGSIVRYAVFGRRVDRSTWVPLDQLGTGLAHALPVVVQHALAAHPPANTQPPGLIITEEPEAHLHPRAQAALVEVLLEVAKSGNSQCLIETHSETVVLRIRRRIAEGLDPKLVRFVWVDDETQTTRASILTPDDSGRIEGWPENWFGTAADEVRAIHRALRG